MTSAADTLRGLLDAANSGTVRLGAARALLELGPKLRESVELEERPPSGRDMPSSVPKNRQHRPPGGCERSDLRRDRSDCGKR
jgi:hypothetical protein